MVISHLMTGWRLIGLSVVHSVAAQWASSSCGTQNRKVGDTYICRHPGFYWHNGVTPPQSRHTPELYKCMGFLSIMCTIGIYHCTFDEGCTASCRYLISACMSKLMWHCFSHLWVCCSFYLIAKLIWVMFSCLSWACFLLGSLITLRWVMELGNVTLRT